MRPDSRRLRLRSLVLLRGPGSGAPGAWALEVRRSSARLGDLGHTVPELRSALPFAAPARAARGESRGPSARLGQSGRGGRGPACPPFPRLLTCKRGARGCRAPRDSLTFLARGPQRSPNPESVDSADSADVRNLGGRDPPQSRRAAFLLRMGSYLGKRGSPAPSPAEGRTDPPAGLGNRRPAQPLHQLHRVQHVHRAHPAPRLRPSRRPRDWDPAKPTTRGVSEAWRRFPMRRPQNSVVGPLPSDWWESYLKRSVWSLRHPRAVWSPVTIKITPPGRRGLPYTSPAQSSPSGKPPGRCVKATVLRALRDCAKGRTGPREPLLRDRPRCERGAPGSGPSAFEPLVKNGVRASFVPRPGPLSRSSASRSSDRTRTGGPLGSRRNAITSSYSSSRASSERRKRSVPGASLQTPERPVKKEEKGHQCRSPIPLGSEESPAASRDSSGQRSRKMPQLLASPGPLLPLPPAPQRGYAASEDHLALGTKGGLLWGNEARKDTTEVAADSVRDSRSALPPPLALALPSAGTAPAPGPDSQGESPGPLASPQSTAEGVRVALSPLQTPSLLAPLGCSLSGSRPGPASGAKSPATVTLPIPVSPASPVIDTTQPPPTSQDDRSARSPQPPVISPAQRCLFAKVRPARHLSASAPPAATSADPTSKRVFGPPPRSETGNALHFRKATAASSPPGSLAPTFEPVFGSVGPLNTMPVTGASSPRQPCCLAPPAPAHTSHDLVKATSVVVSTAPASSSKDSSCKPPLGFDVVSVTSAVDSTPSLPSTCHTFLLGAARAFRASFSTATGFILSPHHPAAIPRVHTVAIFSQALPTAAQMTASRSTVGFRGVGSPLSASALVTTNQPALSPGISNLTSAFTIPLGSNSKPPFPPSLGVTSQPAFGAAGGREQGLLQPVLGPSFNSSFIFKNSKVESPTPSPTPTPTPIPTPAQPAFSSPTQSAFGLLTPSASTFHIPASTPPDSGSTPAFGQASATCFGLVTEAHRSGASSSVFGSTAPRPFAFGGLVTPMDCGESGVSVTAPDRSSNSGVFCIGAMPGGGTRTVMPFGKIWSQNTQALTSQSTPFALGRASISARRAVFGDHHIVPFAQSTPVPGPVKTGRSLGFGVPSLAAQGSFERGSFRSPAPSFSIGAKPKTPKSREQGHSRRHHAHKK